MEAQKNRQITFFVHGVPKPAGSKRGFAIPNKAKPGKHRAILADSSGQPGKDWRGDVKATAVRAVQGMFHGPLALELDFHMPRPQAHYRKVGSVDCQLRQNVPRWHSVRPDVLKLARAVEDALTGIAWRDDSQLCIESLNKWYSESPGVQVTIREIL